MALQVTIAPSSGGSGTTYGAPAPATTGYQCLDAYSSHPVQDVKRFHVPGVNGNYLIRAGRQGRTVMVRVRFMDTTPNNLAAKIEAELSAYATAAHDVTWGGTTYAGCNLIEARAIGRMMPNGRNSTDARVFQDYDLTFTQDQ